MLRYIIKRLIQLIPVLLGLSFFVFLLLYIAPGDAASRKLTAQGIAVSADVIEKTRVEMGLDKPFIIQYMSWVVNLCKGDFGLSYKDGLPVLGKLLKAMRYTFIIAFFSLAISLIVSIPLGIVSAIYKESPLDHVINIFSFMSNAMPNFLISTILIYFFCIRIKIFPVIAKPNLSGLLLPALSLALPISGRFIRQIKAEVLHEMAKPYVTGLRTKGLYTRYIIWKNILRNSLAAIITLATLAFGTLLGGSVVTEVIFNWPGIGNIVISAISARDLPLIQGFVMIMGIIYVGLNLLTDISYKLLDSRIDIR